MPNRGAVSVALVAVALLGDVELRVDDQVVPITRPRLRALLGALALRAGRAVPLDTLAAQVWGDQVPDRSKAGLHTLVNQLRKLVGTDVVRTEQHGYLLDIPPDAVDALRFQRLLDSARTAEPDQVRTALVDALALWRGDPQAAGHTAPHLVERYLSALEQRVDLDLDSGRDTELVAELRQLTKRYPLREPLWARLMTALHRSGRQAEALETYQTIRALLADALGTNPSAELRDLHSAVLAADDDIPARPSPVLPWQLPPDVAGFTGRVADLAALDNAFADDHTDRPPLIVAVHGPGGVGKTTLALHWAHRVSGRFPDGHVHLDMRGYGPGEPVDPATALDVVLRAVGVPASQVPRGLEERTALWRTTLFGRRVLLFLDNVRDAGQVRPLLPGAGGLVLVTSRNELRGLAINDGASRVNLGELPLDDAVALVEDVIGADRGAAEPVALVELVRLCGGLPLALVIAAQQAAQYPDTPIADLVAELRADRGMLDRLGDPDDPTTDPRAVFSWSYRALDADTARAFRRLGLHPTSEVTTAAAAILLREPLATARKLLDTLVSVHLLEQDQRGSYRFHDLLQVYAVELAETEDPPADVNATVLRILDWYLHTMRHARTTTFGAPPLDPGVPADDVVHPLEFTDIGAANAWYARHRATLIAVVEHAADRGHHRQGWQLAFLLRHFQEIEHDVDGALRSAQAAQRCAERSGQDLPLVYATHMTATAHTSAGQSAVARTLLAKALDLSERIDDHTMTSTISVAFGVSYSRTGDLPEALRWLSRGVEAARQSAPLAHALLNLGAVQGMSGKFEDALTTLRRAVEVYRTMPPTYFKALALVNLSQAMQDSGAHAEALAHADEGLALLGAIEDQITLPTALLVKAETLSSLGDSAAAREMRERTLRIFQRTGNPRAAQVEKLLAGHPDA